MTLRVNLVHPTFDAYTWSTTLLTPEEYMFGFNKEVVSLSWELNSSMSPPPTMQFLKSFSS